MPSLPRCLPALPPAATPLLQPVSAAPFRAGVQQQQRRACAALQQLQILTPEQHARLLAAQPPGCLQTPQALLAAQLETFMWLPLRHKRSTAVSLGLLFGLGVVQALQPQLMVQFMLPQCRVAWLGLMLLEPILLSWRDMALRYWQTQRERDVEHVMTTALAAEARLIGFPKAQTNACSALQKIRDELNNVAELYGDWAKDSGVMAQGLAYLALNRYVLTWQIVLVQFGAQIFGTFLLNMWQQHIRQCQTDLQLERDALDAQLSQFINCAAEPDYLAYARSSEINRTRRYNLERSITRFKLLQTMLPAVASVAVMMGFGWLSAAPLAVATYVLATRSLLMAQRFAETALKAPRRYLKLQQFKNKIASYLQQQQQLHQVDLASKVDLQALHLQCNERPISAAQLGELFCAALLPEAPPGGAAQHVKISAQGDFGRSNGLGKSSLCHLLYMAAGGQALLLPASIQFVRAGEIAEHYSSGDQVQARCTVMTPYPARLFIADEINNHLDGPRREQLQQWFAAQPYALFMHVTEHLRQGMPQHAVADRVPRSLRQTAKDRDLACCSSK